MAIKKEFTSFQDMLNQAELPVLVDFYATWCGPCKMMTPILDRVGIMLRNRLQIIKIDSEKYPHLASQYQVQAFPTLILFKQGQPQHRIEGVMQAEALVRYLQTVL